MGRTHRFPILEFGGNGTMAKALSHKRVPTPYIGVKEDEIEALSYLALLLIPTYTKIVRSLPVLPIVALRGGLRSLT